MVHGLGDNVQKPEGLIVVGKCNVATVIDGRIRDHQRIVPSGHVPVYKDISHVHLEQRFDEKCRVSPAKHLREEPFGTGKRDGTGWRAWRQVHVVLMAIVVILVIVLVVLVVPVVLMILVSLVSLVNLVILVILVILVNLAILVAIRRRPGESRAGILAG